MKIHLPHTNAKLHAISRRVVGGGYGTVLLDGGIGGQSSYRSPADYERTTKVKLGDVKQTSGMGLADRIGDKLSGLKIAKSGKPKRKNIVMSI